MSRKFDFSGYATKANLTCSDGRVILPNAFKGNDGQKVPLVWQHDATSPENILGHAELENRPDGVYAYGYFNNTELAKTAKDLVQHGDIVSLSIHANKLKQKNNHVVHGVIREVSLVLAGANPEALIDNVVLSHGDEMVISEDDVVIYHNCPLDLTHEEGETNMSKEETVKDVFDGFTDEQKKAFYFLASQISGDTDTPDVSHSEDGGSGKTVGDVINTLDEKQRKVFEYLLEQVAEANSASHSDTDDDDEEDDDDVPMKKSSDDEEDDDEEDDDEAKHSYIGGKNMKKNLFAMEKQQVNQGLSREEFSNIIKHAQETNSTLKTALNAYTLSHSIGNIEVLFPDAQVVGDLPHVQTRDQAWVNTVISGVRKSPFSRIKTVAADLTIDQARAKGYIKGNIKTEQFFELTSRVTTPTTVYKKQKMDRDDIIDITDMDVVAFIKAELNLMLMEELARAFLLGDGRPATNPANPNEANPDKINETNIRPVYTDDDFFSHKVQIPAEATTTEIVDVVTVSKSLYKGSGAMTMFVEQSKLAQIMIQRDSFGHRLYKTHAELAAEMGVANIVEVELMGEYSRTVNDVKHNLFAIALNLGDYTVGATSGGEKTMFDDFDIDYNQYKYLLETRCCGALRLPKSALVFEIAEAAPAQG